MRKRRATRLPITSEEAARIPHPKAAAIRPEHSRTL
jgi:hypothetical protein